jgi:bifunctional non-homologous end joining protein LigD
VRLLTRTNHDWTEKFKSLADALADLDVKNALIDGEAVHVAEDGTMSLHGLQNALSNGGDQLQYYAFDLLFLDGADLRERPLRERKDTPNNN